MEGLEEDLLKPSTCIQASEGFRNAATNKIKISELAIINLNKLLNIKEPSLFQGRINAILTFIELARNGLKLEPEIISSIEKILLNEKNVLINSCYLFFGYSVLIDATTVSMGVLTFMKEGLLSFNLNTGFLLSNLSLKVIDKQDQQILLSNLILSSKLLIKPECKEPFLKYTLSAIYNSLVTLKMTLPAEML